MDTEDLRHFFRPEKVAILFVGESPPASGTFFYKADSQVFRYMLDAFSKPGGPDIRAGEFLTRFKSLGCYLDDLVESLTVRIRDSSPRDVVAIARSIRAEVEKAVALSGTQAVFHCVAFPGAGRQR